MRTENFRLLPEADALTAVVDRDASLSGNVTIEQGNRLIVAPEAELDQNSRIAKFPKGVRMDEPGIIMQGAVATVDL